MNENLEERLTIRDWFKNISSNVKEHYHNTIDKIKSKFSYKPNNVKLGYKLLIYTILIPALIATIVAGCKSAPQKTYTTEHETIETIIETPETTIETEPAYNPNETQEDFFSRMYKEYTDKEAYIRQLESMMSFHYLDLTKILTDLIEDYNNKPEEEIYKDLDGGIYWFAKNAYSISNDLVLEEELAALNTREEQIEKLQQYLEEKNNEFNLLKEVEKQDCLDEIIKCQFPADYLGTILRKLLADNKIDNNEKEVLNYLTNWDEQFNSGILFFQPFDNIEHFYDVDRDGIANESDEYPFNYYNIEPVFVIINGTIMDYSDKFKRELEEKLFYDNSKNFYVLPLGLSSNELKEKLGKIFDNTKDRKINLLLETHGGPEAIYCATDADNNGSYENIIAKLSSDELNDIFKDKGYSELNVFAELCNNKELVERLYADKSRFFHNDTEINLPGFFINKISKQILLKNDTPKEIISKEKYNVNEEYRPQFLMKPSLEEDILPTKDLPVFEPYYYNPN